MKKPISFRNGRGLTLRGFVFEPRKYDTAVVFLHGFPSSCRGFTVPRISKAAEKAGYLLLVFDFSHTDSSDGKFEDKLMSKEVDDVKYAIDFLSANYPFKQLVVIGHSTGAIDAALYAHSDPRIDKLVLMGPVSDLKHAARYDFTDLQMHDFWMKGYIRYNRPGKWYHGKKLKKAFYDEFFRLDIPAAISKFKKPLLIVHGEKDEVIPVEKDPKELFRMANKPKKLVIIKGSDHSFSNPVHFIKLLKTIHEFVKR